MTFDESNSLLDRKLTQTSADLIFTKAKVRRGEQEPSQKKDDDDSFIETNDR